MRKAILISLLAAIAALAFGCAQTDYATGAIDPPFNKSHGMINCMTDDRFANTQQNLERELTALQYVVPTSCADFFCDPTGVNVSAADAKAWGRFIAAWQFNTEVKVYGGPLYGAGHWAMAGIMDLPDGTRRINTWYRYNSAGSWSCGANSSYRNGAPEGAVAGDKFNGPAWAEWAVETIVIDDDPGALFGENIVAASVGRIGYGYSTYAGYTGRGYEGRLNFTPITRRAGLSEFFAGQPLDVTVQGVTFTVRATLDNDGFITATLDGMSANGVQYAAENPVSFRVNPADNFKTIGVTVTESEKRVLARFALDAGLTDQRITLGQVVPEVGVRLPEMELMISGAALQNYLDNGPGSDGGTGFGG